MNEHLKLHPIQPRHDFFKLVRRVVQFPACSRAIRIRLQQRCRVRLDHVVDIEPSLRKPAASRRHTSAVPAQTAAAFPAWFHGGETAPPAALSAACLHGAGAHTYPDLLSRTVDRLRL